MDALNQYMVKRMKIHKGYENDIWALGELLADLHTAGRFMPQYKARLLKACHQLVEAYCPVTYLRAPITA